MSDRERWIVYPLLFLAIGMSVRNDVQINEERDIRKHAETNLVRCKGIEVVAADGRPRWVIGTTTAGEGLLELTSGEGKPAVRLTSNATGALLSMFNRSGELALQLGYESQQILMLITDHLVPRLQIFAIPILPAPEPKPQPEKTEPEPTESPASPEAKAKSEEPKSSAPADK